MGVRLCAGDTKIALVVEVYKPLGWTRYGAVQQRQLGGVARIQAASLHKTGGVGVQGLQISAWIYASCIVTLVPLTLVIALHFDGVSSPSDTGTS